MIEFNDIFVFLIGFLGAFVGSVAAGSGLITIPGLLLLGIPPHITLGCAKLGGIGFRIGNIIKFIQHKNLGVTWKEMIIFTIIAVPGAILGTSIVVSIDSDSLSKIIGVILIILLPFIFIEKDLGVKENKAKGTKLFGAHILYFIVKIYSGFFGAGSGFFETYVRMKFYCYTILQGKAVTRVAHICSSLASVTIFIVAGFIDYKISIILFLGMLLGGYVGTSFAIQKGDAWIKPLLGVVIVITAIKMIFFS